MTEQLPTIIQPSTMIPLPSSYLIPSMIAAAGDQAAWRYIDFFTANIRNPNTRRAYARACQTFFAWCDERGLSLTTIRPYDVSTYIESRQQTHSAPDVKQQLAAVRMLFDLADHGPGRTHQSGRGGARAEACGENGQDAGSRRAGMAETARQHPDRDGAGSVNRHANGTPYRHPKGTPFVAVCLKPSMFLCSADKGRFSVPA